VKRRDERCALASGCEVRAPEISDDINPREFREERGVIELDGEMLIGAVTDRLPVSPHRADFLARDAA